MWILPRLTLLSLVVLCLGLQLGCQKHQEERTRESEINRAGALIDNDQYTEAIEILEELRTESNAVQIRMYLASAYAGRAGLKSVEYWAISRRYKEILAEEDKADPAAKPVLSARSLPAAAPRWVRFAVPHFDAKLKEFNRVRTRLSALPLISAEKRADLEKAREVLSELSTEGSRLFRAMLSIVLMYSHFEEANELVVEMNADSAGTCSIVVGRILHSLNLSYRFTLEILADLRLAFPSKAEEIDVFIKKNQLTAPQRQQLESLSSPTGRSICKDFPVLGKLP